MRGTVEFPARDFFRELIENNIILNIVRFGGQVSDWSIFRVEICASTVTIFRMGRTGRHVGRSIASSNDGPQALVRRDIEGAVGLRRSVLHRYKYSRCWSCLRFWGTYCRYAIGQAKSCNAGHDCDSALETVSWSLPSQVIDLIQKTVSNIEFC